MVSIGSQEITTISVEGSKEIMVVYFMHIGSEKGPVTIH